MVWKQGISRAFKGFQGTSSCFKRFDILLMFPHDFPSKKTSYALHTKTSIASLSRIKTSIAIFRKKSIYLVSCLRKPLENYDTSKTSVGKPTKKK